MKLDERRWPLSGRCVHVGEQITSGSYGDIFKGTLDVDGKIGSLQIVIKTLNGKSIPLITTTSIRSTHGVGTNKDFMRAYPD